MLSLWWYCAVFEFGKALLNFSCCADSIMGPHSAIFLRFLLNIRSVRILDTIVHSRTLLWLFSQAWDAVELTLQVGFIYPFVVLDPTNLGAMLTKAEYLPFTNCNKARVCAAAEHCFMLCMVNRFKCARCLTQIQSLWLSGTEWAMLNIVLNVFVTLWSKNICD